MKAALAGLVLLVACAPPATEEFRAEESRADGSRGTHTSRESVLLMAWNVEFLWDGVAPEEGKIDFEWKGSKERAERHMADVAEVVKAHDPDILHLSEVENLDALETFNEKFLAAHGYRAYLVDGKDTATGQDVGLLSRIEIETMARDPRRGRSGNKRKSVSKHYIATLRVGDFRLGLVGIHLLARPTRESRKPDREAQADAVRRMARDLADQGRSVVVWGDFNDFDGETLDRSSNRPITRVLEWIRALDPKDPSDDLINVAERLPQKARATNGRDAIDHILLSRDLADRITAVEIPRGHDPHRVTNHYPILVRLNLGSTH